MAQRARDFAANLRKLRDMGLDPMLFNQLVQAGAEAGGETAQAIIDGGQDSVNELNGIFTEINQLGAELGMDVGQTMYDAGQDITYGLLDGIASEQEMLYQLAVDMAKTFSETFKSNFDLAIEAPVAAAKSAADNAKRALDQAKKANVDLLNDVKGLIAGAEKALSGKLPSSFVPGITEKKGIFESLIPDIISGKITELPGLRAGLSTADVRDIAATATGTTVNYNVNVNAGMGADGTSLGGQIVDEITKFERSSGQLYVRTQ